MVAAIAAALATKAVELHFMVSDNETSALRHLVLQALDAGIDKFDNGIAPGANINYLTGMAIFEATHGTAPKYANLDKVNPSSVILSGVMMFEFLGWIEAAELILKGMEKAIENKTVTYDFERLMTGAKLLKCSEFGEAIIKNF